jgi:hypothetical protein
MAFHVHLVPHMTDLAIVADPIGHAHDAEKRLSEETLHPPRAVGFDHLELWVREQRKVQIVLFPEFFQQLLAIGAAAEDYGVQPVEFFLCVAKLGRFVGSTRRHRLGEEIEDYILAAEIGKRYFLAIIRGYPKFGCALANLKWFGHLLFL